MVDRRAALLLGALLAALLVVNSQASRTAPCATDRWRDPLTGQCLKRQPLPCVGACRQCRS